MTAVTRPAEARRSASRMMNSSIRCSFTGGLVGWITKTSCPRIESSILTLISPSGKRRSLGSVSWTSRTSAIRRASCMLALPEMSLSSPHGDEGAVADLGPVLVLAVEVGGDRAGADVGVLAEVRVAQVGHVRHPAPVADLRADQLGEAADMHVVSD